jgi:hypothetical protein
MILIEVLQSQLIFCARWLCYMFFLSLGVLFLLPQFLVDSSYIFAQVFGGSNTVIQRQHYNTLLSE